MKKNVLVYGLISGVGIATFMVFSIAHCYSVGDYEGNMLLGFGAMLLAFSLIFVGVKNYRDKYTGGIITFGKAFIMGLYIALLASTIYVVVWMVAYYNFYPDFMEKFSAHSIEQLQAKGASAKEIDEMRKQTDTWKGLYKTPFGVAAATYMEILPMGLLVALVTALILKRKTPKVGEVVAG
jgi:hypothetical protein